MHFDLKEFCDDDDNVIIDEVAHRLFDNGILLHEDIRLKEFLAALTPSSSDTYVSSCLKPTISQPEFQEILLDHPHVLRLLQGDLVIKDFPSFKNVINEAYESVKYDASGEITTYIPGLSAYDINRWSVSFCSTDGQMINLGDTDKFTIQSTTKPILYGIVSDIMGNKKVHEYVGKEPSGFGFNKISLGHGNIPHNPLINTGAITVTSLYEREQPMSERFSTLYNKYKELGYGYDRNVSFNNSVYLSEKEHGHRNYAIGHYLVDKGCLGIDSTGQLKDVLELYFQLCSIQVDTRAVAIMGAALANGGTNVFSGKQVISSENVKNMLSLMYSCGMYDYSGQWSFEIGFPAKSGVSGVLMIVLPNVGGLALWSPPLDEYGNSVRGVNFTRNLLTNYSTESIHPFSTNRARISSFVNKAGQSCSSPARQFHTAAWQSAGRAVRVLKRFVR